MGTVIGIDWAAKRGWVAAKLRDGAYSSLDLEKRLDHLLERHLDAAVVAVDMPIGLPRGAGERKCDLAARRFVGVRRSSVFATPPGAVLRCGSYVEANALSHRRFGRGITPYSYALRDRIEEVAREARKNPRLIEVHPEVTFCELAGAELEAPKLSWDGEAIRRRLLARAGIKIPARIGDAGRAPVADILDACAAAWSADRYLQGEAKPLPDGSEPGDRPVIWR